MRKMLTQEDLEKYPAWTWDDQNEWRLPLSESSPSIEDYETIFVKSKFFAPNAYYFNGYLTGYDYSFYAFCLFFKQENIGFNINLPEFFDQSIGKLRNYLKIEFDLFPLRYESPIRFKGGGPISGVFEMRDGKLVCIPDDYETQYTQTT